MSQISNAELAVLSDLVIHEPQEALVLLREYDDKCGKDPNFWFNSGGFLIDIGTDLNQLNLVEEGIDRVELAISQAGYDTPNMFYNLANGYSALSNLDRRLKGKDYRLDPDSTPLSQAKYYYRKALKKIDHLNRDFRAQLWVNYGNCLSGLGRAVEAISAYDQALRLFPDHPMAKGNLAVELDHFAQIAEHPIFLLDAHDMLEQVLSDEKLEKCSGVEARRSFEHTRQRIADDISRLGIACSAREEEMAPAFPSEYERDYVEFCVHHGLFLNLCLSCCRCGKYARDSVTFSLITDTDDKTSFTRLSRVINEVKERYAFARLLLFQALHPFLDTVSVDSLTTYVDNLDYAVYGIRIASVKLAFESAYNILDKIAHFINDYLELGVKVRTKLTFTTNGWIWRENKSDFLRPELLGLMNYHLFGLYDLARDLDVDFRQPEQDGYWGQLRRTRNSLTHEYLIPHVEGMHWAVEADDAALHLFYTDLVERTIALLQIVRAAVIYLIAFIDLEERKKQQTSSGFIAPMYVTWYDPALFTPALDGWVRSNLTTGSRDG